MFLKKRYHADIMARLHSNSDNIIKTDLMEDSDDSGFSSDLVIDEDFEENIQSEKIDPEEPEIEEDKSLKIERESVIKHTCALSTGMNDEKERGKERPFDEGCCTKMNSIIGIKRVYLTHIIYHALLFQRIASIMTKRRKPASAVTLSLEIIKFLSK